MDLSEVELWDLGHKMGLSHMVELEGMLAHDFGGEKLTWVCNY